MWKIIVLLSLIALGLVGGYGFVSGGNLVFNPEVRFVANVSQEIYLDSQDLKTTVLVYQSNINIENASITSLCKISSKFLTESKGLYFFKVDYAQAMDCDNGNVVLSLGEDDYANTIHALKLMKDRDLYGKYIDYSSEKLKEYQKKIDTEISRYAIYKNYDRKNIVKYYQFFAGQKKYQSAVYKNTIINTILEARKEKYSTPVAGKQISTLANRIPNAGRPYRKNYTDGIHHGWDVYGKYGEDVIALDDGIIVRIVDGFSESDFSRIVYGDNISIEQELKNLDILRGNQVWLKTMKGEIVFYSHLSFIESNLEEGTIIEKGKILGKIGTSGVPEEGYDDYHLHFSIMQNPYNFLQAGSYDFGDYMAWDWLTKGQSYNEIIQKQNTIFE